MNEIKQGDKTSITAKVMSVGAMGLVLIIAASMIAHNVSARQESWNNIRDGLVATWAGPQEITGPVLMVPVQVAETDTHGRPVIRSRTAWFLPDLLSVAGSAQTELLAHGICKTSVYTSELKLEGRFPAGMAATLAAAGATPRWDQAKIELGVGDLRGIRDEVALVVGKDKLIMEPGGGESLGAGALDAKLSGELPDGTPFSTTLKLRGSQRLGFLPLGKTTTVDLASPWPSPEFNGPFFPDTKDISSKGFSAAWKIQRINRNIPQFWIGGPRDLSASRFGVDFAVPVDYYRATTRAAQYAVMFIFLTFVVFFFVEFFLRQRMHPMQYLLAGAGIVLFYLLLLSLAEHLPFPVAYLLAGGAIVATIASYTQWVFHRSEATASVAGILSGLYAFFYTLLQMEEYSLLLGSFGLLAALVAVMYLTRDFDWFDLENLSTRSGVS